jgi:hypothetical protein
MDRSDIHQPNFTGIMARTLFSFRSYLVSTIALRAAAARGMGAMAILAMLIITSGELLTLIIPVKTQTTTAGG